MKNMKNLTKRSLALLLALVLCLGMLPMSVFAAEATTHEHNQDGWVCTQAEGTRELVCEEHVHTDECYTTERGDLTCEAEEHEHGDGCYEAAEPVLTCEETEHTHDEDCFDEDGELTCGLEEHTHGDACYTQGEDVLVCGKTAHTHGDDCYAVVTVKVCDVEEDHEHTDDCYEVVEGEWTCTAPVVEETPAEVQAFLAAVAALPAPEDVTPDNAEEIGYQVNAVLGMWDAMSVENGEREDVTEALNTAYAVFAAVLAAEEIDEGSVYTGETGVTKSAFSRFYPKTNLYNTVSHGWAETGYGTVILTDSAPTAADYVDTFYWGAHIGGWAEGFYNITATSSNDNVVRVNAYEGTDPATGHPCIVVEFNKGTQEGVASIEVDYTVTQLTNEVNIAVGSDSASAVSGCLRYNVGNGVGDVVSGEDVVDCYTVEIDLANSATSGHWWQDYYVPDFDQFGDFHISKRWDKGYLNAPGIAYYWIGTSNGRQYWAKDTQNHKVMVTDPTVATAEVTPYADDEDAGSIIKLTGLKPGKTEIYVTAEMFFDMLGSTYLTDFTYRIHLTVTDSNETRRPITLTYHDWNDSDVELTGVVGGYAGDTFTINSQMQNKPGYTFKGWAESKGSTTVKWEVGKDYVFNASDDLYAVWEKAPAITGITKEVMSQYEATQAGLNVTGISSPNYKDGPLTFYNNAVKGTLLYKITVTGEAGAAYTVTDEGAVWVQGGESHKTENGVLTVTGAIPEGETEAVIYVTKLFEQSDIKFNPNKSCYVENTATVTPGVDGAPSTDATATTQLTPFTVDGLEIRKEFVGLTEAQIPGNFQMTYTVAANNDTSVVYAEGTLKLTGGSITPTVTKDEAAKTITYTWAIPRYTRPTSLQTDLTLTETNYAVGNYNCTSTPTVHTTQGVTNGTVTYSLGMNDASPDRGIINTYASNETETTYRLTYDANGGQFGDSTARTTWTAEANSFDATYTFTVENPETNDNFAPNKAGCTLLGWSETAGGAVKYTAGEEIILPKDHPTKTIYAVWQEDPVKPEAPNPDNDGGNTKLLRVKVVCDSTDTNHGKSEHLRIRPANDGVTEYTVGEVVASEVNGYDWQCPVTVHTSDFKDRFDTGSGKKGAPHEYKEGTTDVTVMFYYKDGAWICDDTLRTLNPGVEMVYEKNDSENYFVNYVVFHVAPKTTEPETKTLNIRKVFAGIEVSDIPSNFALSYTVDGGEAVTLNNSEASKSDDGLTWNWKVQIPKDAQTVAITESDADVTDKDLTVTTVKSTSVNYTVTVNGEAVQFPASSTGTTGSGSTGGSTGSGVVEVTQGDNSQRPTRPTGGVSGSASASAGTSDYDVSGSASSSATGTIPAAARVTITNTYTDKTPVKPEPNPNGIELVKKINGEDQVNLTVANRGDELTYTITVTNNTNVDLANMLIRDRMPAGVTLVENSGSVTVNGETRNVTVTETGAYHDWKVAGDVADVAVVVLTYKAVVTDDGAVNAVNAAKAFAKQAVKDTAKAASFKMARYDITGSSSTSTGGTLLPPTGPGNTGDGGTNVTIGGIDTPDGYGDGGFTSNEDSATVTAPELSSALTISKSIYPNKETAQVQPGEEVWFYILVTNTSNQTVANVKVTDALPEGLTYVSSQNTMTQNYDAVTPDGDVYSLGSVGPNITFYLRIIAKVNDDVAPGTTITNTATAKGDGTTTVTDSATITVVEKDATLDDLTITKTANTGSYKVGDQIEYNIKITNAAGQPAVVRVVDILPEGLEYVSSPCGDQYLDDAGNHRWNVKVPAAVNGTPGEFTVTVYARATKAGTLTNTATVQLTNNTVPFGDTKQDTESVEVAPTFEFPSANSEGVYVRVNCSTNSTHNSASYWKTLNARNADGTLVYSGNEYYTIGEVTKNAEGKYQCVVTINPETWADMRLAELTGSPAHVYDPEKTQSNNRTTLTYVYNADKGYWRVDGSTVTVAFIKHVEHTVTVQYMCDENSKPFSAGNYSYSLAEGENYNHSVDASKTGYPQVKDFNKNYTSPKSFTIGSTWTYDEVLTTNTLAGTMGDHDIVIEVWYSRDNKGTINPDGTDTSDGIPDKYQAKVVYTAGAGGTITSATKSEYLTIKDASGNMATTGTISITGATAAPTGDNRFVNWTAGATGHNGWSYAASDNATLAADNNVSAKGGAVYTFTANFQANPGTPLEVKADDVTVTYDGATHPVVPTTNKDGATVTVTYTYVDENGHTVTLPAGTEPTDAGVYTATVTAKLGTEEATDSATVTIGKKELTVTTDSASKVHDGNPLTAPGRIDGLVGEETVTFTVTGSQTEVGVSDNTYTLAWDGTAKESNYTVTEGTIGTLTVTAPVIVIPDPVDTTYTLNYNANGGEGAPASQSQLNSNVFTVSGGEPTREGYTFQGWATTPDGAVSYQAGSSITITGLSQTLYAVWQQDEEDITDENPPLTELPDTGEENPDADLPKDPTEELPDEEDISDEDVPLTDVPKTGDHTNRFLVMAAVSGLCLLTLLSGRKKEDEA